MTLSPLARDLRLKAERALATARELQDHDPDGSVNRSYYAMFDIARAALLSAGVREDELPRTHSPNPQDKISEPDLAMEQSETDYVRLKPVSLDEIRREARENWLRLRQGNVGAAKGISNSKDTGRDAKEDQIHSIDDDLGE